MIVSSEERKVLEYFNFVAFNFWKLWAFVHRARWKIVNSGNDEIASRNIWQ